MRNSRGDDGSGASIQVLVVDAEGNATRAGAEVRIYRAGTDELLGAQVVDPGSGYNSQNAAPVHFGLPGPGLDGRTTRHDSHGSLERAIAGSRTPRAFGIYKETVVPVTVTGPFGPAATVHQEARIRRTVPPYEFVNCRSL